MEAGENPARARRRDMQSICSNIFLTELPQISGHTIEIFLEKVKNMHKVEILSRYIRFS